MDSTQQYPLAAGLLTALTSSVTPTPTALPSAAPSWPPSFPALTSDHDSHNGDEAHGPYEWSSLIGIVTALVGNVLISLALNIQRYAHLRIEKEWEREKLQKESDWKRTHRRQNTASSYGSIEGRDDLNGRSGRSAYASADALEPDNPLRESVLSDQTVRPEGQGSRHGGRKSYLRSPYWWLGIVLMTLGETGNFMAYGFAPASIVSPLGVVALISNCVIAPFMLKEKFRRRDFWGVLIAIAGAVVVVLSAKSSEEKIGPHDIWKMITRWEFELYLGLTSALIVGLMWASGKYGSRTILIDVGLVALFGGYTALSTKGVSSLLSFTWWHVITFPITYLLVFVLVFSALMQIRYINRALQRFDSTQVIPTQFVLFTLSVIVGSAVLYQDFRSFGAARAGKFIGGCLLTFLGVYFITSGRVSGDDESSYSVDDEEEAIGLLAGDRYQDAVDLSPPRQQARLNNMPRPKSPGFPDGSLQSPSGSLLSRELEDIDDNQSTPRAGLSAIQTPSPAGSLEAESLLEPQRGSFSSSRPSSLLRNPWIDSPGQASRSIKSAPPIERPRIPPGPVGHDAVSSTVLLRFPPAPGADDAGTQSLPPGPDGTRSNARIDTVPQTPPRKGRNSISSHFSPGPLLPTLSAGFSAVIADSIRRGEMSTAKEGRASRRGRRKKLLSTSIIDGVFRNRDTEGGEVNQDPDAALWDRDEPRLLTATAPLDSADELATAPVLAGPSTPGVEAGRINRNHSDGIGTLSRLRSLSDSWNKSVPWLSSVLQKRSENQTEQEDASLGGSHAAERPPDRDDQQGPADAP